MGTWKLKDKRELDAYQCLALDEGEILQVVDIYVNPDYKLSECDMFWIFNRVRNGFAAGVINEHCSIPRR